MSFSSPGSNSERKFPVPPPPPRPHADSLASTSSSSIPPPPPSEAPSDMTYTRTTRISSLADASLALQHLSPLRQPPRVPMPSASNSFHTISRPAAQSVSTSTAAPSYLYSTPSKTSSGPAPSVPPPAGANVGALMKMFQTPPPSAARPSYPSTLPASASFADHAYTPDHAAPRAHLFSTPPTHTSARDLAQSSLVRPTSHASGDEFKPALQLGSKPSQQQQMPLAHVFMNRPSHSAPTDVVLGCTEPVTSPYTTPTSHVPTSSTSASASASVSLHTIPGGVSAAAARFERESSQASTSTTQTPSLIAGHHAVLKRLAEKNAMQSSMALYASTMENIDQTRVGVLRREQAYAAKQRQRAEAEQRRMGALAQKKSSPGMSWLYGMIYRAWDDDGAKVRVVPAAWDDTASSRGGSAQASPVATPRGRLGGEYTTLNTPQARNAHSGAAFDFLLSRGGRDERVGVLGLGRAGGRLSADGGLSLGSMTWLALRQSSMPARGLPYYDFHRQSMFVPRALAEQMGTIAGADTSPSSSPRHSGSYVGTSTGTSTGDVEGVPRTPMSGAPTALKRVFSFGRRNPDKTRYCFPGRDVAASDGRVVGQVYGDEVCVGVGCDGTGHMHASEGYLMLLAPPRDGLLVFARQDTHAHAHPPLSTTSRSSIAASVATLPSPANRYRTSTSGTYASRSSGYSRLSVANAQPDAALAFTLRGRACDYVFSVVMGESAQALKMAPLCTATSAAQREEALRQSVADVIHRHIHAQCRFASGHSGDGESGEAAGEEEEAAGAGDGYVFASCGCECCVGACECGEGVLASLTQDVTGKYRELCDMILTEYRSSLADYIVDISFSLTPLGAEDADADADADAEADARDDMSVLGLSRGDVQEDLDGSVVVLSAASHGEPDNLVLAMADNTGALTPSGHGRGAGVVSVSRPAFRTLPAHADAQGLRNAATYNELPDTATDASLVSWAAARAGTAPAGALGSSSSSSAAAASSMFPPRTEGPISLLRCASDDSHGSSLSQQSAISLPPLPGLSDHTSPLASQSARTRVAAAALAADASDDEHTDQLGHLPRTLLGGVGGAGTGVTGVGRGRARGRHLRVSEHDNDEWMQVSVTLALAPLAAPTQQQAPNADADTSVIRLADTYTYTLLRSAMRPPARTRARSSALLPRSLSSPYAPPSPSPAPSPASSLSSTSSTCPAASPRVFLHSLHHAATQPRRCSIARMPSPPPLAAHKPTKHVTVMLLPPTVDTSSLVLWAGLQDNVALVPTTGSQLLPLPPQATCVCPPLLVQAAMRSSSATSSLRGGPSAPLLCAYCHRPLKHTLTHPSPAPFAFNRYSSVPMHAGYDAAATQGGLLHPRTHALSRGNASLCMQPPLGSSGVFPQALFSPFPTLAAPYRPHTTHALPPPRTLLSPHAMGSHGPQPCPFCVPLTLPPIKAGHNIGAAFPLGVVLAKPQWSAVLRQYMHTQLCHESIEFMALVHRYHKLALVYTLKTWRNMVAADVVRLSTASAGLPSHYTPLVEDTHAFNVGQFSGMCSFLDSAFYAALTSPTYAVARPRSMAQVVELLERSGTALAKVSSLAAALAQKSRLSSGAHGGSGAYGVASEAHVERVAQVLVDMRMDLDGYYNPDAGACDSELDELDDAHRAQDDERTGQADGGTRGLPAMGEVLLPALEFSALGLADMLALQPHERYVSFGALLDAASVNMHRDAANHTHNHTQGDAGEPSQGPRDAAQRATEALRRARESAIAYAARVTDYLHAQTHAVLQSTPELMYLYQHWPGDAVVEEMLAAMVSEVTQHYVTERAKYQVNIDNKTRMLTQDKVHYVTSMYQTLRTQHEQQDAEYARQYTRKQLSVFGIDPSGKMTNIPEDLKSQLAPLSYAEVKTLPAHATPRPLTPFSPLLFAEAYECVYNMVEKDVYKRFVKSPAYTDLLLADNAAILAKGNMEDVSCSGWADGGLVNEHGHLYVEVEVRACRNLEAVMQVDGRPSVSTYSSASAAARANIHASATRAPALASARTFAVLRVGSSTYATPTATGAAPSWAATNTQYRAKLREHVARAYDAAPRGSVLSKGKLGPLGGAAGKTAAAASHTVSESQGGGQAVVMGEHACPIFEASRASQYICVELRKWHDGRDARDADITEHSDLLALLCIPLEHLRLPAQAQWFKLLPAASVQRLKQVAESSHIESYLGRATRSGRAADNYFSSSFCRVPSLGKAGNMSVGSVRGLGKAVSTPNAAAALRRQRLVELTDTLAQRRGSMAQCASEYLHLAASVDLCSALYPRPEARGQAEEPALDFDSLFDRDMASDEEEEGRKEASYAEVELCINISSYFDDLSRVVRMPDTAETPARDKPLVGGKDKDSERSRSEGRRTVCDGYNLDLSYVAPNIIVMPTAVPASAAPASPSSTVSSSSVASTTSASHATSTSSFFPSSTHTHTTATAATASASAADTYAQVVSFLEARHSGRYMLLNMHGDHSAFWWAGAGAGVARASLAPPHEASVDSVYADALHYQDARQALVDRLTRAQLVDAGADGARDDEDVGADYDAFVYGGPTHGSTLRSDCPPPASPAQDSDDEAVRGLLHAAAATRPLPAQGTMKALPYSAQVDHSAASACGRGSVSSCEETRPWQWLGNARYSEVFCRKHSCPPFLSLFAACLAMHRWLHAHPQNVLVIQSRDGLARPALLYCCYELLSSAAATPYSALQTYTRRRTQGVSSLTPSQQRYIHYFHMFLNKLRAPQPSPSPSPSSAPTSFARSSPAQTRAGTTTAAPTPAFRPMQSTPAFGPRSHTPAFTARAQTPFLHSAASMRALPGASNAASSVSVPPQAQTPFITSVAGNGSFAASLALDVTLKTSKIADLSLRDPSHPSTPASPSPIVLTQLHKHSAPSTPLTHAPLTQSISQASLGGPRAPSPLGTAAAPTPSPALCVLTHTAPTLALTRVRLGPLPAVKRIKAKAIINRITHQSQAQGDAASVAGSATGSVGSSVAAPSSPTSTLSRHSSDKHSDKHSDSDVGHLRDPFRIELYSHRDVLASSSYPSFAASSAAAIATSAVADMPHRTEFFDDNRHMHMQLSWPAGLPVAGDVCIQAWDDVRQSLQPHPVFALWFNTNFLMADAAVTPQYCCVQAHAPVAIHMRNGLVRLPADQRTTRTSALGAFTEDDMLGPLPRPRVTHALVDAFTEAATRPATPTDPAPDAIPLHEYLTSLPPCVCGVRPRTLTVTFQKQELDYACRDAQDKLLPASFKCEIEVSALPLYDNTRDRPVDIAQALAQCLPAQPRTPRTPGVALGVAGVAGTSTPSTALFHSNSDHTPSSRRISTSAAGPDSRSPVRTPLFLAAAPRLSVDRAHDHDTPVLGRSVSACATGSPPRGPRELPEDADDEPQRDHAHDDGDVSVRGLCLPLGDGACSVRLQPFEPSRTSSGTARLAGVGVGVGGGDVQDGSLSSQRTAMLARLPAVVTDGDLPSASPLAHPRHPALPVSSPAHPLHGLRSRCGGCNDCLVCLLAHAAPMPGYTRPLPSTRAAGGHGAPTSVPQSLPADASLPKAASPHVSFAAHVTTAPSPTYSPAPATMPLPALASQASTASVCSLGGNVGATAAPAAVASSNACAASVTSSGGGSGGVVSASHASIVAMAKASSTNSDRSTSAGLSSRAFSSEDNSRRALLLGKVGLGVKVGYASRVAKQSVDSDDDDVVHTLTSEFRSSFQGTGAPLMAHEPRDHTATPGSAASAGVGVNAGDSRASQSSQQGVVVMHRLLEDEELQDVTLSPNALFLLNSTSRRTHTATATATQPPAQAHSQPPSQTQPLTATQALVQSQIQALQGARLTGAAPPPPSASSTSTSTASAPSYAASASSATAAHGAQPPVSVSIVLGPAHAQARAQRHQQTLRQPLTQAQLQQYAHGHTHTHTAPVSAATPAQPRVSGTLPPPLVSPPLPASTTDSPRAEDSSLLSPCGAGNRACEEDALTLVTIDELGDRRHPYGARYAAAIASSDAHAHAAQSTMATTTLSPASAHPRHRDTRASPCPSPRPTPTPTPVLAAAPPPLPSSSPATPARAPPPPLCPPPLHPISSTSSTALSASLSTSSMHSSSACSTYSSQSRMTSPLLPPRPTHTTSSHAATPQSSAPPSTAASPAARLPPQPNLPLPPPPLAGRRMSLAAQAQQSLQPPSNTPAVSNGSYAAPQQ